MKQETEHTRDVAVHVRWVTERVVVLKHVQVEGGRVSANLGQKGVVGGGPAARQHIVVPVGEVDQLGEWVVQAAMETDDQGEVRVGIVEQLPVCRVLQLLYHLAVTAEDGERRARVV